MTALLGSFVIACAVTAILVCVAVAHYAVAMAIAGLALGWVAIIVCAASTGDAIGGGNYPVAIFAIRLRVAFGWAIRRIAVITSAVINSAAHTSYCAGTRIKLKFVARRTCRANCEGIIQKHTG